MRVWSISSNSFPAALPFLAGCCSRSDQGAELLSAILHDQLRGLLVHVNEVNQGILVELLDLQCEGFLAAVAEFGDDKVNPRIARQILNCDLLCEMLPEAVAWLLP